MGAIGLAELCRDHLIEMAKAKLDQKRRLEIAGKLLDYITSPEYRIPLEEVTQKAGRAREVLMKEVKYHMRVWAERNELYQSIGWDASFLQDSIGRVLNGDKPLTLTRNRPKPLLLPGPPQR